MNEQTSTPSVHSFPNRDAIREMAKLSTAGSSGEKHNVSFSETFTEHHCEKDKKIQRKESDSLLPLLFALLFMTDTASCSDSLLFTALLTAISVI